MLKRIIVLILISSLFFLLQHATGPKTNSPGMDKLKLHQVNMKSQMILRYRNY